MNNEEKILEMLTKQGELLTSLSKKVDKLEEQVQVLDERSLKSSVLLETEVARDTRLLYEGHSEMKRKIDTLATKEQVEEVASDVEVITIVVARHSGDISRMRKAQ